MKKLETPISFVIPAKNEELNIGKTLNAISEYADELTYEIIVVDNGSTDATAEIAKSHNARILTSNATSIGMARNEGVNESNGNILVFLDADVSITREWKKNIQETIAKLAANPMIVTGSRITTPNKTNFLNKYWFGLNKTGTVNYINSGHLITSKVLFDTIGGFTEELKTAEDYDFCLKATKISAEIMDNNSLIAVHDGYPIRFSDFVQRERWHGAQDFKTIKSIKHSKVALIVLLNISLLVIMLTLFVIDNFSGFYPLLYIFSIIVLLMLMSIKKFGLRVLKHIIPTGYIFSLYLLGRTLSLFDRIFRKSTGRFREL